MKLELLNINEYIEKNSLKPVTTIRMYEKVEKTDPNGLFSEEIFGRFGLSVNRVRGVQQGGEAYKGWKLPGAGGQKRAGCIRTETQRTDTRGGLSLPVPPPLAIRWLSKHPDAWNVTRGHSWKLSPDGCHPSVIPIPPPNRGFQGCVRLVHPLLPSFFSS